MKNLSVNENNFSEIRETLKNGEKCNVNNVLTIVSFESNTERISENGKKVRTPFMYILENGTKVTSTKLKALLNIEPEKKGERKETTFATIWEQAKGLAKDATETEIQEAAKYFQELLKAKKEAAKAAKAAKIAELERQLKALKGK